jgi:hypothetical protein
MSENSIPVNTPVPGTVNTEELIMNDDFMNEIMGRLAPGDKKQEVVQENVQTPIEEKTNEIKDVAIVEKEKEPENVREEVKQEEQPKVQDDGLEKRFKDAQSMIGRQSNELGQLRKQSEIQAKQLADMQANMEADRKSKGQDATPYYEKLLNNSPDVLAQQLNVSKEQVETLQLAARIAKDIAKDEAKPFQQAAQEMALQKEVAKKDASWYGEHPDYKNRQPVMAKFLNKLYPDGPVAAGVDPWQAAHMAYEHAGEVMTAAQQTVVKQNDQRIVNGRSAEGSTRSVDANAGLKPQVKPMDAKATEINRVLDAQLSQLIKR